MKLVLGLIFSALFLVCSGSANPYPDRRQIPKYKPFSTDFPIFEMGDDIEFALGKTVLRVDVKWLGTNERYEIRSIVFEPSGTETLSRRSTRPDPLGIYEGILSDEQTGTPIAFHSVGTGSEMRKLTRGFSFRFPLPSQPVDFTMKAENPITGIKEKVLSQRIDPDEVLFRPQLPPEGFEVRVLKRPSARRRFFSISTPRGM